MQRRSLIRFAPAALLSSLMVVAPTAWAADEAPNAMIERLSNEVITTIRNDQAVKGGDFNAVMQAVDRLIMPNINFRRMVASAVGPSWRKASAAQQQQLQDSFKSLIVSTYSGALSKVNDQKVSVLPMRGEPGKEALVRTRIHTGGGEPVQVDYRLEQTPGQGFGWKVYDLNVAGIWMVENYRTQFAQVVSQQGVDGLIRTLNEKVKSNRANLG